MRVWVDLGFKFGSSGHIRVSSRLRRRLPGIWTVWAPFPQDSLLDFLPCFWRAPINKTLEALSPSSPKVRRPRSKHGNLRPIWDALSTCCPDVNDPLFGASGSTMREPLY